ncbi:cyclase family protein [Microbacterium sp.]|uniref:cyclase family protein n=1 Tax=Microbacterium sp. TaxID=51671 RepID=UPI003A943F7A
MNDLVLPSYDGLKRRPGRLAGTAWELFGRDDQLGTLNHLTPDRVKAALEVVSEGRRFGLNLPLNAFNPPLIAHRGALRHDLFGLNEFHRDERLDNLFTQASTQIDGLRHFAHPDHGFYNNFDGARIVSDDPTLGIQAAAEQGIVGRGHVIDVAAYRESIGKPIDHAASEGISIAEVEATLTWQGSEVRPGDILLFRFGWIDWYRSGQYDRETPPTSAGLMQREETAAWLWDQRIAMAAADNIALEAWPASDDSEIVTEAEQRGTLPLSTHTGMLHRILIPLLGLTIGELWDLDELAVACHARQKYDALIFAEPLNVVGGVGSPANALALI